MQLAAHGADSEGQRFIAAKLRLHGFKQITEYRVEEKTDPVFQEVEMRTRNARSDRWVVNTWEAMAFEAVR